MIAGLGNDVVDLDEAGTPGARFVERVFSPEERERAARARRPREWLWRMWAAKEAAYKALARSEPALVFAHARFCVEPEGDFAGRVLHGGREVRVRWSFGGGFVSCAGWLGSPGADGEALSSTATLAEAEALALPLTARELESVHSRGSRASRLLAKRTCAERLGVAAARIEIVRPALVRPAPAQPAAKPRARLGPPELWLDGAPCQGALVSLSQHGRFAAGALACCLNFRAVG